MTFSPAVDGAYELPPLPLGRVRTHARGYADSAPYLLGDLALLDRKVARFRSALPGVQPHYAMKANPDSRVLARLAALGVGFEIASIYELHMLERVGVDPARVVFSNPIKPAEAVAEAFAHGVTTMVVDDLDEVDKIAAVSGDIRMVLRMETANTGSDWPLTGKFGATVPEAQQIIDHCGAHGLPLIGLTFHVGSQCRNVDNWHAGIAGAMLLFDHMRRAGLTPELLNLGGGFPVQHTRLTPTIEEIGATVRASLASLPTGCKVIAEPGRFLVGDAFWMVTTVVGTATRKGHRWLYLDVGAFTGLTETLEGFDYELFTDREGAPTVMTVAGPSCDTCDVLFSEKMLPRDLQAGDRVYIANAGAYTTAYASTFNGFPLPNTVLLP